MMNVSEFPTSPKPPKPKKRTISLTNQAPIRIIEDDWPVIAQSQRHENRGGTDEYGWVIEIRLRRHKDHSSPSGVRNIVHARYHYQHPDGDGDQSVRVGRMLADNVNILDGRMLCETSDELRKHICAVGEELRERIINPEHRIQVTLAVDSLFEDFEPRDVT